MYVNGEFVKQNDAEAIKLFRASAEQGVAKSQLSLGYMLRDGRGFKKDHYEASKWYKKAADQGNTEAKIFLEFVSHTNT